MKLPQTQPSTVWPSDEDHAEVVKYIEPGRAHLAIGPAANWGGKEWPLDRFGELIQNLRDENPKLKGAKVFLFGAPQDSEKAEKLVDQDIVNLCGRIKM